MSVKGHDLVVSIGVVHRNTPRNNIPNYSHCRAKYPQGQGLRKNIGPPS